MHYSALLGVCTIFILLKTLEVTSLSNCKRKFRVINKEEQKGKQKQGKEVSDWLILYAVHNVYECQNLETIEWLLRDYWETIERLSRDYWETIERPLRDHWVMINRWLRDY